jgi:hypothetical protein
MDWAVVRRPQALALLLHLPCLVTSQADTIPVGDYAFQRTYGMGSSNALLFAFPRAEKARPEWIQFDLNEFGLGTGSLRFRFRQQDLEAVPPLKFNQEAH